MNLPFSSEINNQALSSVFNYTSATYKFYWFLAIIDEVELGYKQSWIQAINATFLLNNNQFNPYSFNIGINVNEEAGQTVFHCHIHIIPRYKYDVKNPRGGVRGVIPSKQKY